MARKQKKTNDITQWYKKIPKELIPKYDNPSYQNTLVNHPARVLVVGASGSGKTQVAIEFLNRMADTFHKIVLVCKNASEPLYQYLIQEIDKEMLDVFEGGEMPPLAAYQDEENGQVLAVFDDLVNEPDQRPVTEWFIRGRKAAKGITMMYLTQVYFKPQLKAIRLQCNFIIIRKLSSMRDLNAILEDFNLGLSPEQLLRMYRYCTDTPGSFLMVDVDAPAENRFRRNFLEVLDPSRFG